MEKLHFWFHSTQFTIEPDEDEETNPGCFGKSLAEWLALKLKKVGYETEVIPEDWGWCVMCKRMDFMLWVGCGSVITDEILDSTIENPPSHETITWHVFTHVEIPFFDLKALFKKWFGKLDLKSPLAEINKAVSEILKANPHISFCEEP